MVKKKCSNCNTTKTPKWRGELCNKCWSRKKSSNNGGFEVGRKSLLVRMLMGSSPNIASSSGKDQPLQKQKRVLQTSLQALDNTNMASHDEATKQKEMLANELKCLREELKQIRDDRDHQLGQLQAEVDILTNKSNALEETCTSQREQISMLQQQLTAAKENLKETCASQREQISMLQQQLTTEKENLKILQSKLDEAEETRRQLHNNIMDLKGNIRVFCRIRPPQRMEGPRFISYPRDKIGQCIEIDHKGRLSSFTFDRVFNEGSLQEDVFLEISQLVQSALDGYKVCIFAYGQTGSGKTHTMMGKIKDSNLKGLIPRSLEQILQSCQSRKDGGWHYQVEAEMLEIYNNELIDLMATTRTRDSPNTRLTIKLDKNGDECVAGLKQLVVSNLEEILDLLEVAVKRRSTAMTEMNDNSSRSHFVFTLRISGVNNLTKQKKEGVLNLIDLAGSEKLNSNGDKVLQKETKEINLSLLSLNGVITALKNGRSHVPYRNSLLTRILRPYLGGDSKALMFLNVSSDDVDETFRTLSFVSDVNSVGNKIPQQQAQMATTSSIPRHHTKTPIGRGRGMQQAQMATTSSIPRKYLMTPIGRGRGMER